MYPNPRVLAPATVFLSSFLLFFIQPLIARFILPWYGGGAGIWMTCMLFFQAILLLGYGYSHFLVRLFPFKQQVGIHLTLLCLSLVAFPIHPTNQWKAATNQDPVTGILLFLITTLGVPFLFLSATSPLVQAWLGLQKGKSPYRLYALSNIGSFLALLAYPFWIEPHWPRVIQLQYWSFGYLFFVILHGTVGWSLLKFIPTSSQTFFRRIPKNSPWAYWLLLPACSSLFLISITNKLCQDIAAIPFLWILPLSLYLLSFVLCFDHERWYPRILILPLWIICFYLACGALLEWIPNLNLLKQVLIYSSLLFLSCMICHGEFYRLRPTPEHLSTFYFLMATGSTLGSSFVVFVATFYFPGFFELHFSLAFLGLLLLVRGLGEIFKRMKTHSNPIFGWKAWIQQKWFPLIWGLGAGLYVYSLILLGQAIHWELKESIYSCRNFYGVLNIMERDSEETYYHHLLLNHGSIIHGLQFTEPSRRGTPTTYYAQDSGVGILLSQIPAPRKIGVVGLGAGTLASYAEPDDQICFFEINPDITRLAKTYFHYLEDCKGKVSIIHGDARQTLESLPNQEFDILILDAFSGDAIPIHLLTLEAFQIYEKHMKPDGVLAVHITNSYVDLDGVVDLAAWKLKMNSFLIYYDPDDEETGYSSDWMLLSKNRDIFKKEAFQNANRKIPRYPKNLHIWTDDFSSLFEVLVRN